MKKKKVYESINSTCKDCGKNFVITAEEQKRLAGLGYVLPKRCGECRQRRREARKAAEEREQGRLAAQEAEKWRKQEETNEKQLRDMLRTLPFHQLQIADLALADPSKALVIIGNGFDIMHGAKSSYWDFQKTIGKNSSLRFNMEIYLDTDDLWSNLEESLGRLNYSTFLNPYVMDMWLEDFGAYDPDASAAAFYGAVETAIAPTFDIPRELNQRLRKWVKTLTVDGGNRPFAMLRGDYKVLCFNYTEFIEELYGARQEHICYIHGCRKKRNHGKPEELILGHRPGMEEEQWDEVTLKPFNFKNAYKRSIMQAAMETAANEAAWYDESTTKNCGKIIEKHRQFFASLSGIEEVYVIGHSLSEVDYPYFDEVKKNCHAKWFIGYHSLDDMGRLLRFVDYLGLKDVAVFRT
jgi:hypothetical protein